MCIRDSINLIERFIGLDADNAGISAEGFPLAKGAPLASEKMCIRDRPRADLLPDLAKLFSCRIDDLYSQKTNVG